MRPGSYPLALYRGDSYAWRFQLMVDGQPPTPDDLTGVTAKAEIRDAPGGTTIVALTCTVTQPNIVDVTLPASAWAALAPGAKLTVWDLQLTYPTSEVFTCVAGSVTVTPDVTDSTAMAAMRAEMRRRV